MCTHDSKNTKLVGGQEKPKKGRERLIQMEFSFLNHKSGRTSYFYRPIETLLSPIGPGFHLGVCPIRLAPELKKLRADKALSWLRLNRYLSCQGPLECDDP